MNYSWQPDEKTDVYGSVIFHNPENKSARWFATELKKYLIGGEFFVPDVLGLPVLYEWTDADGDADYHALDAVDKTELPATDSRSADEFLSEIQEFKRKHPEEYW